MPSLQIYLFKKALNALLNWLSVAVLCFFLLRIVGGDPASLAIGIHSSSERIETLRSQMQLNDPLWSQFARDVIQALSFNWGISWMTHEKVGSMIASAIQPTLSLTVPPFFIAWLITLIVLGKRFQRGSTPPIGHALPLLLSGLSLASLALIFQYLFGYHFRLLPLRGWEPLPQGIQYYILPWGVLIIGWLGPLLLHIQEMIQAEDGKEYLTTARMKGLSSREVYYKHLLPNLSHSLLNLAALQIPFLFLGSFLIESFFSLPGLGNTLLDSFQRSDLPVIKAIILILSLFYILAQAAVDIWIHIRTQRGMS